MDIHEKDTLIDQDQRFKGALLCQMNVFTCNSKIKSYIYHIYQSKQKVK
jgi:hypothetical protein